MGIARRASTIATRASSLHGHRVSSILIGPNFFDPLVLLRKGGKAASCNRLLKPLTAQARN